MERDTKELKIDNHTFVVKTYATAREAQAIQQTYFKGSKIEVVGEQPKINEFNPGVQFEVEKELIAQVVVSLDQSKDAIVDRCLDLPAETYNTLISQLDELVAKKKEIAQAIDYYSMGKADPLMQIVTICQEFGWTYEEYMSQPNFFLTLVKEKMVRDHKAQELALKKAHYGK